MELDLSLVCSSCYVYYIFFLILVVTSVVFPYSFDIYSAIYIYIYIICLTILRQIRHKEE